MDIKERIRQVIKTIFGVTLYKKLPFGLDPLEDLSFHFGNQKFKIIYDVGANIGQSANLMRAAFPNAVIHSFEPVESTFEKLKKETSTLDLNYHQIGLGANEEVREITVNNEGIPSDMNTLHNSDASGRDSALTTESIQITTLDKISEAKNILKIDYLKIDTEGYDLEVLKGGRRLLNTQAINFVEAEVSMNPENSYHVDFVEVKNFLESLNYRLFGLYEQVHEWQTKRPVLRRVNALFISKKMYESHTLD